MRGGYRLENIGPIFLPLGRPAASPLDFRAGRVIIHVPGVEDGLVTRSLSPTDYPTGAPGLF